MLILALVHVKVTDCCRFTDGKDVSMWGREINMYDSKKSTILEIMIELVSRWKRWKTV